MITPLWKPGWAFRFCTAPAERGAHWGPGVREMGRGGCLERGLPWVVRPGNPHHTRSCCPQHPIAGRRALHSSIAGHRGMATLNAARGEVTTTSTTAPLGSGCPALASAAGHDQGLPPLPPPPPPGAQPSAGRRDLPWAALSQALHADKQGSHPPGVQAPPGMVRKTLLEGPWPLSFTASTAIW